MFEAALRINRRNGDNGPWPRHPGLADLAGDAGDWDRAAALHGAAQAFRTGRAFRGRRATRATASTASDQARAHLGDEQLERAYARGMALSLEKALDLALRRAGPA